MTQKDKQQTIEFITLNWSGEKKTMMFKDLKEHIDRCKNSMDIISLITDWDKNTSIKHISSVN